MEKSGRVLLAVCLIRGLAGGGINMTASLFLPQVAAALGVGIGTVSVYLSIVSATLVLVLPTAGRLLPRTSPHVVAIVGAALMGLSYAALGLMDHVFGWYLLAVPLAIGAALVVNLLGPVLLGRWFARRTGLVMGVMMAAVGLMSAILQQLAAGLIGSYGWRAAYGILGVGVFAAVCLCTLLLPRGGRAAWGSAQTAASREGLTAAEAAKLPAFYLIFSVLILLTGAAVFTQHIPAYCAALGRNLQQSGLALAVCSVGNAIGAVAIGAVCDRLGGRLTGLCLTALWLGAVALFAVSHHFAVLLLASFFHGLCGAGVMVLAPLLAIRHFGRRDYARIFARVSMGTPLASILLVPAYGYLYDAFGSYRPVLGFVAVLLVLAGGCFAALRAPAP